MEKKPQQPFARRILSWILCIAMVLSLVPAVFASSEPFDFMGANMALDNSLAMSFAFASDHYDDWTGFYAEIVKEYADGREDVKTTVPASQWDDRTGYFVISYNGIAAKEMADEFHVTIYNAEGVAVSNTYTDSVSAYARRTLDNDASTEALKSVLVDMLNYGAAAQTYFTYGTEAMANSVLTEDEKALASAQIDVSDVRVKGDNFAGSQLILESNIRLVAVFSDVTADMTAQATYTDARGNARTVDCQIELVDDFGKVNINALAVADYNCLVDVTVYNADGSVFGTASDSVASYVCRNNESDEVTQELKALGNELVKFADSAYNYFCSEPGKEDNTLTLTGNVSVENGQVTQNAAIGEEGITAQIPAGVQVESNTLTLTISEKSASDSGIEAAEGEELRALDIHIDGVSEENTTAIQVYLGSILPVGLNIGNITLYHT